MISFETLINKFCEQRLLVVGDIMLDRFIYGQVDRISPEAPAPVMRAGVPEEIVGGAGNVARNVSALGACCEIISVTGTDEAAHTIFNELSANAITPILIKCPDRVTTVKTRFVATLHNTHLLRADWEETAPISEQLEDEVIAAVESRLPSIDAIILSDYAKGCLTPRVIAEVIALARAAGRPVIVDPKGNDYTRYAHATALTPNLNELAIALGESVSNEDSAIERAARKLIELSSAGILLITRSERGVALIGRDTQPAYYPATAPRVVDVSGAGDTIVASFALALVGGAEPHNAARLANAAAGLAVSKKGTSQVSCDELREVFLSRPHFEIRSKILAEADQLETKVRQWRTDGFVVGFTNGCFDLLHPGHISLLAEARARCDRLIIGLNSDLSVKRLKGNSRPIQNETARSIVLAALSFVDGVVLFGEDTPLELIMRVKPDILIKGADYRLDQVVGRDFVESYGGKVSLIELVPNSSTSRLVSSIKSDSEGNAKLDLAS